MKEVILSRNIGVGTQQYLNKSRGMKTKHAPPLCVYMQMLMEKSYAKLLKDYYYGHI